MIKKIEGFKNGYDVSEARGEEWNDLIKDMKIETIYMNKYTRQFFKVGLFSNPCITITNKLVDMVVYINGMF